MSLDLDRWEMILHELLLCRSVLVYSVRCTKLHAVAAHRQKQGQPKTVQRGTGQMHTSTSQVHRRTGQAETNQADSVL